MRIRRAADGEYRWLFESAVPLRDEQGNILKWYGFVVDIEDRKRAEEVLHKTQMELAHVARVTTLGELTASIAHEVNQPLAAIVTNGEIGLRWLDREVPDLGEVREALGDMISNGRRAGEIIQRLRALSRKTETQKAALDINDVIEEVILLVHSEVFSHRVSLRLELAPRLPAILGDRVQLQQVIINLIVNGMEAMASVTDRPRELVVRSQLDDSGQVLVTIQDFRRRHRPGEGDAGIQRLLHDQAERHGHGAIDLPLDHREPRREIVGLAQCRAWCDVPVRLAAASRALTRATQEERVAGR